MSIYPCLRRAVRTVATLALFATVTVTVSPAAADPRFPAAGVFTCSLPTETECLEPGYRTTWCGGKPDARELCDLYALEGFRLAWSSSAHPMGFAIPPRDMPDGGFRVNARVIPAAPPIDSRGPSSLHHLAHIRTDELEVVNHPATYATMTWAQRLAPRHGHGEDFRVRDCAGYVYKRWYEYSRFEDAARTCGTDAMCVFEIGRATTTPGIAGPLRQRAPASPDLPTIPAALTPRSQDPSSVAGVMAPLPYQAKNAFFRVTPAVILRASTQFATDATFANDTVALVAAVGTPPGYDTSDRMQWHLAMEVAQRPLALGRAERRDIALRLARYHRLVDEYRALAPVAEPAAGTVVILPGGALDATTLVPVSTDATGLDPDWVSTLDYLGASWTTYDSGSTYGGYQPYQPDDGGGSEMPSGLPPAAIADLARQAVLDEMAELLMNEWRHLDARDRTTMDRGCLIGVACDWAPELFQDDYVGRFQGERQADLAACQSATAAPIATTDWRPPWLEVEPDAEVGGIPEVEGADVIQLAAYIQARREANRMLARGLPWSSDLAGAPGGSRNIRWGIAPVREAEGIASLLHASYAHHATADLALKFGPSGGVCNLSAGIDAGITAEYTAPRLAFPYLPETRTMLDGGLEVKVNRDGAAFYAESHLVVADKEVFPAFREIVPITGGSWAPPPLGHHFPIYAYAVEFMILGIPAFLAVDIQGDVSLAPRINVPPYVENCATALPTGAAIMPKVEGSITAKVDIDADGRFGVGIPGFSVGVNGHVDVLTATLPATATFQVVNEGVPTLRLDASARLDVTLLGGSLSVYARAFILYVEQQIFGWPGISVGLPLWNEHLALPLTDVADVFKETP